MDLILKPTELCNFKCTFCSSTDITDDKAAVLDLEYVFSFLDRYPNTNTIIINGGDPLMVKPRYYWDIIEYLDRHNLQASISFTTNLWAFYKKPSMWEDLFKHERVGVATSFNYGDTRRVTDTQIFTEDLFWEVSNTFLDRIGYRPGFISVINDSNEDTAIDNVRLAKKMGVECKLNYAMSSGAETKPYMLAKMYKIYTDVYNQDLWRWEYNTKQMMHRLNNKASSCPQNRNCDSGIRVLQPSGDYYSCGAFGDDRQYPVSFFKDVVLGTKQYPLKTAPELMCLKEECLTCPMFQICNGCKKTISDLKQHGMVTEHCNLMKSIAVDIVRINAENETTHCDVHNSIADSNMLKGV